ncbi:hypothetical protein [Azospirillum doebereinerae]
MPLDAPATSAATLPRWAEEPPVPPDGSLVPGSRFAEEQWVMAAGMLARGSSFLHVARALGCSRTTLWRAYYGSQALRVRVWWERQALNREAELRLASLRDLVAQQVERLVSMGDPATVRWAADRLGLFAAPGGGLLPPSPAPGEGRGPPRSGGKGEGLSEHGSSTTPDSPSPSPLRGSPPSPGAGEGFGVADDRVVLREQGSTSALDRRRPRCPSSTTTTRFPAPSANTRCPAPPPSPPSWPSRRRRAPRASTPGPSTPTTPTPASARRRSGAARACTSCPAAVAPDDPPCAGTQRGTCRKDVPRCFKRSTPAAVSGADRAGLSRFPTPPAPPPCPRSPRTPPTGSPATGRAPPRPSGAGPTSPAGRR